MIALKCHYCKKTSTTNLCIIFGALVTSLYMEMTYFNIYITI